MDKELETLIEKINKAIQLTEEETALLTTKIIEQKTPARKLDLMDVPRDNIRPIQMFYGNEDKDIPPLPPRLWTPAERELLEFMDDAYIVSTLLSKPAKGVYVNPRQLKMWQGLASSQSALRKAMDTATAGEGLEWVPTALSPLLIQAFRLESKVAALINDIPMPSNPYTLPFISGAGTFYLVPETTSDEPSKPVPWTATTGKRTLTAVKLKSRTLFSDELSEDSIVPILPALKAEMVLCGKETLDDVIINGDTTVPHQDSDVVLPYDHRKAWIGLRKLCQAGNKKDLGTFDKDTTRSLLTALGKFGVNSPATTLTWIAGIVVYNAMRGLAELLTVDKYGPGAVILTGEVAKLYGIPVIVSEKIRENLNATGVYDGATTDNTILPIFYRPAFCLGSRGTGKLDFLTDPIVDQNQLVVSFRKAFVDTLDCSVAANDTIALGYNITV